MELSLNCKPTTSYVPKTITEFIKHLSTMGNVSEKLLKLDDFINRLQDEMRKIDVFKRELPLCMLLINDAIVALKNELMECRKLNVEPVFEEFIPLKKSCDVAEKDEVKKEKDSKDKMNWMSSVQLWNSVDHPKQKGAEDENHPRAFVPFKGYSSFPVVDKKELAVGELSLVTPGIESCREELGCSGLTSSKASSSRAISCSGTDGQSNLQTGSQPLNQQTSRKQRRCWSPELHRRFVSALQQLGGSQAATPKQIRELMQVDGLTNDEVKSHLQKYRLHTRRVSPTTGTTPNESRFVMGNLWMANDEYGESSKQSNSESGSPQGPFNGATGGTSTTGGDSMEEEEDDKSENYSWKSHVHTSGKDV